MMMAMADLQYIIVKAAHSEKTVEAGISEISMDIGQERRTEGGLASAVEECSCPPGYKGLSCESCAPGYTRSGLGLYLGTCQPCDCNGKSSTCDPEVGTCLVRLQLVSTSKVLHVVCRIVGTSLLVPTASPVCRATPRTSTVEAVGHSPAEERSRVTVTPGAASQPRVQPQAGAGVWTMWRGGTATSASQELSTSIR